MKQRIITSVIVLSLLSTMSTWGQTTVIKRNSPATKPKTGKQNTIKPVEQEKGIYYLCLNWGYNLGWTQQVCREMRAKGYPAIVVKDGSGYMTCVKSFKNREDVAAFYQSFSDSRYHIQTIRYNNHDISSWDTGLSTEQLLSMNGNQLYQLAEDYYFGKNEKSKDISKAQHCYYQAAYIDYVPAQLRLGQLYEEGGGTYSWEFKKDLEAAIYWYKQAAAQGDDTAKNALPRLNEEESILRRIKTNKNTKLWSLGCYLCYRYSNGEEYVLATLEEWNNNHSKVKIKIVASPSANRVLNGDLLEKNNTFWVSAQNEGWHLALDEEISIALKKDNSEKATK